MTLSPLLAFVLQATAAPPEGATSWSVLAEPCSSARSGAEDIVVCGRVAPTPRLPLPADREPPDRPMPSNPDVTGIGALRAAAAPCATRSEGCTVGLNLIGPAVTLVRGVGKILSPESCCEEPGEATDGGLLLRDIARGVKKVTRKKDKRERIPIEL